MIHGRRHSPLAHGAPTPAQPERPQGLWADLQDTFGNAALLQALQASAEPQGTAPAPDPSKAPGRDPGHGGVITGPFGVIKGLVDVKDSLRTLKKGRGGETRADAVTKLIGGVMSSAGGVCGTTSAVTSLIGASAAPGAAAAGTGTAAGVGATASTAGALIASFGAGLAAGYGGDQYSRELDFLPKDEWGRDHQGVTDWMATAGRGGERTVRELTPSWVDPEAREDLATAVGVGTTLSTLPVAAVASAGALSAGLAKDGSGLIVDLFDELF